MCELRRLFALMVGSKRKYVDPSKAVDILKEAFAATAATGVGDSQQVTSHLFYLKRVVRYMLPWLPRHQSKNTSNPN